MIVLTQAFAASDPLVRGSVIALGEHNVLWFAGPGKSAPRFDAWRLRYRGDAPAGAVFLADAPTLLELGEGSCSSLACAMYGWIRGGLGDDATLIVRRLASGLWHSIVRLATGTIWDPEHEVPHA